MQVNNDYARTTPGQQQTATNSSNPSSNQTNNSSNQFFIISDTEFQNQNLFSTQQKTCLFSNQFLSSSNNNCKPQNTSKQKNPQHNVVYNLQSSLPCNNNIQNTTTFQPPYILPFSNNINYNNNMNNQLVSSDINNIRHIPSNMTTVSNLQTLPNNTFSTQLVQKDPFPPPSSTFKPFTINYSWDGILPLTPVSPEELNSEWELFQFHQQKTKEHHLEKERKLSRILQQISELYGQDGAMVVLQSLVSKLNNSNSGKPISISELIASPNFHVLLENIGRILEAKKLSLNNSNTN